MEKKKKSKSRQIMPYLLGTVIFIGIVFGVREFFYYRTHVDTDDAQIDGDISPVSARVGGYIKSINFSDNQMVKAGDLLVIIDDADYKLKLEQARAALRVAQANAEVSTSDVSATQANTGAIEANLRAAKATLDKAQKDFKRYTNLYKEQAITKEQLDAASVEETAAQSQVQALEKQLISVAKNVNTNQAKVEVAKSNIAVQQAAVDFAEKQLSYTKMYAPCDGIVSNRNVQLGQLVQPGQTLFAVVHSKDIYVTANFKETKMQNLKVGEKVDIKVDAYPDLELKGVVESFSGATGAKFSLLPPNNATGNYVKVVQRIPVKIKINANPAIMKKLKPGMSADVSVHIKE